MSGFVALLGTSARKRAKNEEVDSTGAHSTQSGSERSLPSLTSSGSGGAKPVMDEAPAVAAPPAPIVSGAPTLNPCDETATAAHMVRGDSTLAHVSSFDDLSNEGRIAKARFIRLSIDVFRVALMSSTNETN